MDTESKRQTSFNRRTFMKSAAGSALGLTAASGLLAACGNTPPPAAGSISVVISNAPDKGTDPNGFTAWNKTASDFTRKYPQYKIKPNTLGYDIAQFQAQYVAGKAADCFQTFYTEMPGLIQHKYAYDIDDIFHKSEYSTIFLSANLKVVSGSDGHIYGLPYGVYGQNLMYNRTLFSQAGLDPDKPPLTWQDVRDYSKRITDKTGKSGFLTASAGATGGWMFTSWLFTNGGQSQVVSGGHPKAVFNSDKGVAVLKFFQNMRFVDKSMDNQQANFNHYDCSGQVAIGKAAMCIAGDIGSNYKGPGSVDHLGLGPMPQDGGTYGTLGGGNVWVVNYKNGHAHPEMPQGAVDYTCFTQYNLDYYEQTLKAQATSAKPPAIGIPDTAMYTADYQKKRNDLIAKYANLPVNNYKAAAAALIPIIPEPKYSTQDMYTMLDSAVQAAVTQPDADFHKMLDDIASTLQSRFLDKLNA